MGVDTRISLPGNVRVKDVASVIGALLGLPVALETLNGGDGVWAKVDGARVMGFESIPEMCRIDLWKNGACIASYNFHFENPGGRRSLTGRATAENIAVGLSVANFFGGIVDFSDCDEEEADYELVDKSDDENHPEDGEPWDTLQRRIAAVKRISQAQLGACNVHAAY